MSEEVITPLLETRALAAGYDGRAVLHDVSMHVDPGEIVAVVGHNGAGKSTLLRAVFGMLRPLGGTVLMDGVVAPHSGPHSRIKRGIALVEQGAQVFADLTVWENLAIRVSGASRADTRRRVEFVASVFPVLATKLRSMARTLSGGEKQMLAISSTLMVDPRVILLDEPTMGLAPILVGDLLEAVGVACRANGTAAVIVEHRIAEVLAASERVYVLRDGRVVFSGRSATSDPKSLVRISCFCAAPAEGGV